MDNQDKERFCINITEEWARQGVSLIHLSIMTGLSAQTLMQIRRNSVRPTETTCMKLCKALGVRPMEMIR